MTLSIAVRGAALPAAWGARLAPPLRGLVRITLARERRKTGDIAVVLGDDRLLRELNRRYRGLDRSTDVLSFPYGEDDGPIEGDIVVSVERARLQARRFRVSLGREVARLVVHGALHLAGLDHHTAAERRVMKRHESDALAGCVTVIRDLERRLGDLVEP